MSLPEGWQEKLTVPVVAAPMFLISHPGMVIETCKAGAIGTFPALNQRTSEGFEAWLIEIKTALASEEAKGNQPAPFGVNLIVHPSNPRLQDDLALCVKHEVPLIITSLGAVSDVIDAVHQYGGVVFHDVTTLRHAKKAAQAGVDGLIAVSGGAGGHAGTLNPFSLLDEIRSFFEGTVLLAGCINRGQQVAAAQLMGADLAYMGTRFINTQESAAQSEYKQMIIDSIAEDIIHTPAISGIPANFLAPSLENAGFDLQELRTNKQAGAGAQLDLTEEAKAWKDVWSAGHGVASITDIPSVAELVSQLREEFLSTKS